MAIRTIAELLADLDLRARPAPASKNRQVQKFTSVSDVVGLSSDTTTTNVITPPFKWHAAGSTAVSLIWGLGEWRA